MIWIVVAGLVLLALLLWVLFRHQRKKPAFATALPPAKPQPQRAHVRKPAAYPVPRAETIPSNRILGRPSAVSRAEAMLQREDTRTSDDTAPSTLVAGMYLYGALAQEAAAENPPQTAKECGGPEADPLDIRNLMDEPDRCEPEPDTSRDTDWSSDDSGGGDSGGGD